MHSEFPQEKERSRSRKTSEGMAQLPNSHEFSYEISSRRWAKPLSVLHQDFVGVDVVQSSPAGFGDGGSQFCDSPEIAS